MLWKGFQRPKRIEVEVETHTDSYARLTAQPFEREGRRGDWESR